MVGGRHSLKMAGPALSLELFSPAGSTPVSVGIGGFLEVDLPAVGPGGDEGYQGQNDWNG